MFLLRSFHSHPFICSGDNDYCASFAEKVVHLRTMVSRIKRTLLYPRIKHGGYYLTDNELRFHSQFEQDKLVDRLLRQKKHGFFVEAGAEDGEFLSNSLFFERFRDWQGLLVEPSPRDFNKLLKKGRNAFILPGCLSDSLALKKLNLICPHLRGLCRELTPGAIENFKNIKDAFTVSRSICYPLPAILLALNQTKIDYLSLDIEGSELDVLTTIPTNLFDITVITIEFLTLPTTEKKIQASIGKARNFFEESPNWKNRYIELAVHGSDLVFVKAEYLKSRKKDIYLL